MRLDLIARHLLLSQEQRALVLKRLGAALDRFAARIARIEVRFDDVNGPRGGRDVVAVGRLVLAGGGELTVRGDFASPEAAASGIGDRLRARLAHAWGRRQAARG